MPSRPPAPDHDASLPRLRSAPLLAALMLLALSPFTPWLASPTRASTGDLPVIDAPVVDLAGVMTAADIARVDAELRALRDATGVQMAVLVVQTTGLLPIEEFSEEVFTAWGGGSRHRNDGVLFVLAIGDRRNRIQTGYGIEPLLPDTAAVQILESIKPALRSADYAEACLAVVAGVRERVAHLTPDGDISSPPIPFGAQPLVIFRFFALAWFFGLAHELFGPKKASDTPHAGWRKLLAKLPVLAARPRRFGVWIVPPIALFVLFSITTGPTWGLAYAFSWWVLALLGVFSGQAFIKGPVRAVFYGLVLVAVAGTAFTGAANEIPVPDALTVGTVAISALFILGFITAFFVAESSGGGSSGSGSYSGSRSSSSSSSRSSSSYSSSPSSSSSSSSRGWSGGGGRTGGGGASSSW